MQPAVMDHIKKFLRSFSILGLITGLTCVMLTLLLQQPESASCQYNRAGYAKSKRTCGNLLFTVPVLLYPVQPAGGQDDADSSIE